MRRENVKNEKKILGPTPIPSPDSLWWKEVNGYDAVEYTFYTIIHIPNSTMQGRPGDFQSRGGEGGWWGTNTKGNPQREILKGKDTFFLIFFNRFIPLYVYTLWFHYQAWFQYVCLFIRPTWYCLNIILCNWVWWFEYLKNYTWKDALTGDK